MSGLEEDVLRIRERLEKLLAQPSSLDESRALELLRELSGLKMSLGLLTTTRIGMTVNALRKASRDDDVVASSKALIKTWKKCVPDSGEKAGSNGTARPEKNGAASSSSKAAKEAAPKAAARAAPTGDEVRLGCRNMIANALKGSEMPDGVVDSPENIAELVEETIFKRFKDTGMRYKALIRSRVFNLRDKKNPSLRENVLCGVIKPDKLAVMTPEEMASEDVKRQRQAFIKEGIDRAQLAQAQGTRSTLLKCGKCGKNDCTYTQIQTRSADEPMTTFALCNVCGNRWKFN